MLQIEPTKHLTGITIQGDYNDLYELVESIYRMSASDDNPNDLYYAVKMRLLGVCYEFRHAYMGDRELALEDNGMHQDLMKWHKTITPTQNVYYRVNILFPEAIFVAAAVPKMCELSDKNYTIKKKQNDSTMFPYVKYLQDKANLDVLCAGIWNALGQIIGDEELAKLLVLKNRTFEYYYHYATQYIDKCNIELLKTDVNKRTDKLKSITKRIIKKPQAYFNMEEDLRYWASEYGTTIYSLEDTSIVYPEEIIW